MTRPILAVVLIVTFALASASAQSPFTPTWQRTQAPGPSPFQFSIKEIRVEHQNQPVFLDQFKFPGKLLPTQVGDLKLSASMAPSRGAATNPTPTYIMRMGAIGDANVKSGALVVTQTALRSHFSAASAGRVSAALTTTNVEKVAGSAKWASPDNEDMFAALVNVPVRAKSQGNQDVTTFTGSEMFGNLKATMTFTRAPGQGWEKLLIGLTDVEGRRPAAKLSFRRDRILLEGVRTTGQPANGFTGWFEVELAAADLRPFKTIGNVTLTIHLEADGEFWGEANLTADNQQKTFELRSTAPESKLDAKGRYAVGIYTETLPLLRVGAVTPSQIERSEVASRDATPIEIRGMGFGPDTAVEIISSNPGGMRARVDDVQIGRFNNQLSARVGFPNAEPGAYSLRITTGGQETILENAIRIE